MMNTDLVSRKEISELILKVLTNQATPEDCLMLDEWIKQSDENKRFFLRYRNVWMASSLVVKTDRVKTLNALEQLVSVTQVSEDGSINLTFENAQMLIKEKSLPYDKGGAEHYDVISAFIKSVRGSDVDAALHYLARMIEGGEDPMFIARRLIILASEDIGLADSNALILANSCAQSIMLIGMPEGRIILGHVTAYLAKAPKSNSAYMAIDSAISDIKNRDIGSVPEHLQNYNDGYVYPHNFEDKDFIVEQQYLPNLLKGRKYYVKKKFDK